MNYDFADAGAVKLSQLHPCLSGDAHTKFGRLHLPVCPSCNIGCRFCRRTFHPTEQRPGVSSGIISPEEALERVGQALELCPEITVVGIAGPGDTLATNHALETFRLVHERYPDLIKCLSTNGLLLPDKAKDLYDAGVRTVTVTVNAVDPEILTKIVAYVVYDGQLFRGEAAAELLISRQLLGISAISALGAVVKVNSVLIPGVNDRHIADIAAAVREAGASIYNIIPLIPQHEFADTPAPDCDSLAAAREAAEQYIEVFRHCKHCRADACGIPGKSDLSSKLYASAAEETFSHG